MRSGQAVTAVTTQSTCRKVSTTEFFICNHPCLLLRLAVAFVGVEVSLAETDALRGDLNVLAISDPLDGLFEG